MGTNATGAGAMTPSGSGRPWMAGFAAAANDSECTGSLDDAVAIHCRNLLSRLVAPICPASWGGRKVLWPIWADEMVHRTHIIMCLVNEMKCRLQSAPHSCTRFQLNDNLAGALAASLRALVIGEDTQACACAPVMRAVSRDLVELFGPATGDLVVRTKVEPLGLPAFQRRALVLIAFGVMSNVLLTRSRGVHAGNIDLVLSRVSHVRGRLAIHHSGMVMLCRDGQQISNDLASLLETRIIYGNEDRADCIVEMDFPLSGNMS